MSWQVDYSVSKPNPQWTNNPGGFIILTSTHNWWNKHRMLFVAKPRIVSNLICRHIILQRLWSLVRFPSRFSLFLHNSPFTCKWVIECNFPSNEFVGCPEPWQLPTSVRCCLSDRASLIINFPVNTPSGCCPPPVPLLVVKLMWKKPDQWNDIIDFIEGDNNF